MPFSLKIVRKFKGVLTKFDIDYDQLERILALKLMMDRRRTSIFTGKKRDKGKDRIFGYEQFLNLFIGCMLAMIIGLSSLPILYNMAVLFGTFLTYSILYMLSDFSTVILDVRDKKLIGVTPIKGVTLNMAKLIHITIYLSKIMLEIMIIPFVTTLMAKGFVYALVLFIESVMLMFFAIFMTTMIYYGLMCVYSGEKLKDILNYIQMVVVIVVVLMQQILPRLIEFTEHEITYSFKWWYYAVTPIWMAAPFELLEHGIVHKGYIVLSIIGIVVPILLFVLYLKKVSPYFENKLMKTNNSASKQKVHSSKGRTGDWIGKIICKSSEEYGYYKFVRQLMASERKFKFQMYPQIAMGVFFPIIFSVVMIDFDSSISWIEQIRSSKSYFYIYMMTILSTQCLIYSARSENYKAAWIYKLLPIHSSDVIYRGALKAVAVKFLLPAIVYEIIYVLLLGGISEWINALVIAINSWTLFMIYFRAMKKTLPFSIEYDGTSGSNSSRVMIATFLIFIIAGVHYGIAQISHEASVIFGVISFIIGAMLYLISFRGNSKQFNMFKKEINEFRQ